MTEIQTVRIHALAFGGYGVGRLPSGKAVLVSGSAPQDYAAVEILQEKSTVAFASVHTLLESSPDRTQPRCPVAHICGGCSWQHIAVEVQRQWKRELLHREIKRMLPGQKAVVMDDLVVGREFGHRTRTRMHRRADAFGTIRRHSDSVVPLTACPVLNPDLERFALELAAVLADMPQHDAEIELYIDALGCRGLYVEPLDGEPFPWIDLARGLDVSSVRMASGMESSGEPLQETSLDSRVLFRPGNFVQTNREMNQHIVSAATELAGSGGAFAEIYAGVGNFTIHLAGSFDSGTAVEADDSSAAMLDRNLQGSQDRVSVLCDDDHHAGEALAQLKGLDLLLVDPPRQGIKPLYAAIRDIAPKRIVMASCHPMAAVRDAAYIVNECGYRLERIVPIDVFPQNDHMELMALMSRG